MNGPRTIDVLYAYIVVADDGTETVPAILVSDWDDLAGPVYVPLMGTDRARMNALQHLILADKQLQGKMLWLVKFETRRLVDTIEPREEITTP